MITEIGPDSAADTFAGPVESIASDRGTAGVAFVLGLAIALWSASGYVGAFIRASHAIYATHEGGRSGSCGRCRSRSPWRWPDDSRLLALGLVLDRPARRRDRRPARARPTAVEAVWKSLKWPVMAAISSR